jgi:hypothetical protein
MVNQSRIANNQAFGLNTTGAGATIRVGNSSISGNATATGGNTLSYGNNLINANGVDTVPAPVPGGMH